MLLRCDGNRYQCPDDHDHSVSFLRLRLRLVLRSRFFAAVFASCPVTIVGGALADVSSFSCFGDHADRTDLEPSKPDPERRVEQMLMISANEAKPWSYTQSA